MTLKRTTYLLDDEVVVNILHELLKAEGRPITRRYMRDANRILKLQEYLHKDVKRIKKHLNISIERDRRGYWLPEEYRS